MKRRQFLHGGMVLLTALTASTPAFSQNKRTYSSKTGKAEQPDQLIIPNATSPQRFLAATSIPAEEIDNSESPWRDYLFTCTLEIPLSDQSTRIWLPLPADDKDDYQRSYELAWSHSHGDIWRYKRPDDDLTGLCGRSNGEVKLFQDTTPMTANIKILNTLRLRDRNFDISVRTTQGEREQVLRHALSASYLIPKSEALEAQAKRIIGHIKDPVAKARALYDWTTTNSKISETSDYGQIEITQMLSDPEHQSSSSGICALFVTLCRNSGLPARLMHGLMIDQSRISGLPGKTADQQPFDALRFCRAEFYVSGYGWIPVDPAAAVQIISSTDDAIDQDTREILRKKLFGFWQMNWIAFNSNEETKLPYFNLASVKSPFCPAIETNNKKGVFVETPTTRITAKLNNQPDPLAEILDEIKRQEEQKKNAERAKLAEKFSAPPEVAPIEIHTPGQAPLEIRTPNGSKPMTIVEKPSSSGSVNPSSRVNPPVENSPVESRRVEPKAKPTLPPRQEYPAITPTESIAPIETRSEIPEPAGS